MNGEDGQNKIAATLKTAREEFLNGVFIDEEKKALTSVFIAEHQAKTASDGHDQAKALAEKKIITPLQVEAAAQAVQNAKLKLDSAKAKLNAVRETKTQVVEQFARLEQMIQEFKAK